MTENQEEIEQIRARHLERQEKIDTAARDASEGNRLAALCHGRSQEHDDRARLLAIVDEMRREREPQVLLTGMGPHPDGGFGVTVEEQSGGIITHMANCFVGVLESLQAPNYIEHRLESPDGKRVIVTLQKWNGKTPHELRQQAEEERDRERARAEKAEADAKHVRHINSTLATELVEAGKEIEAQRDRAIAAEAALTAAREKVKGLDVVAGDRYEPHGNLVNRSEVLAALGIES